MYIVIGIDDTDNLTSRGTGYMARQLSAFLFEQKLMCPELILRHQLLVDSRIPYTSHNSSASIKGLLTGSHKVLQQAVIDYLIQNSANGSDVGLCIAYEAIKGTTELINWGFNAKKEVLDEAMAYTVAEKNEVFLVGLTGEKTGVIGALAAVGLHFSKNDGRVLWIEGLREAKGVFVVKEMKKSFKIDKVIDVNGIEVHDKSNVLMTEWTRPVMQNGNLTLFVEKSNKKTYEYESASKAFIKSISE